MISQIKNKFNSSLFFLNREKKGLHEFKVFTVLFPTIQGMYFFSHLYMCVLITISHFHKQSYQHYIQLIHSYKKIMQIIQ